VSEGEKDALFVCLFVCFCLFIYAESIVVLPVGFFCMFRFGCVRVYMCNFVLVVCTCYIHAKLYIFGGTTCNSDSTVIHLFENHLCCILYSLFFQAKVKKTEGKVISVGPGRTHPDSGKYFPMPVSTGDGVIYGKFDGTELDYNGKPHTLIRDVDIMVRYTDGDKLTLENAEMVFDNVLVHIVEEESTSGGLLIASTANKEDRGRQCTGTVVKVGPGKMVADGSILDMNVEVGDKVKFRDFAGNEVTIGGEEYSVVAMTDILAKF